MGRGGSKAKLIMSSDAMQNWLIAIVLIAGAVLSTFITRFFAHLNENHLQRLAELDANRRDASNPS